jgi:hypothetical protein
MTTAMHMVDDILLKDIGLDFAPHAAKQHYNVRLSGR